MTPDETKAQERAREYFRSKAGLSPATVREQITAAYESLAAVLAEVTAAQAPVRAIPDEWSVQEIVDHLLETYRPGVDELRCVLAGQRPPGEPIPAALQSKAPRLRPWPWLVGELRRVHESVVELVGAVPADFVTEACVPVVMVVNVTAADGRVQPLHWVEDLEWKAYALVSWRLHAIDHLKQVRKVLAAAR
jgi:hypothetical protein